MIQKKNVFFHLHAAPFVRAEKMLAIFHNFFPNDLLKWMKDKKWIRDYVYRVSVFARIFYDVVTKSYVSIKNLLRDSWI